MPYDIISASLNAVARGSAWALLLVFFAGVVSSCGPCAAPKLIAAAGLASGRSSASAALSIGALMAGLVTTYVLFGLLGTSALEVWRRSGAIYAAMAPVLVIAGLRQLWNDPEEDRCTSRALPNSGTFLLGSSLALAVSPCCAPVLLGVLAYTSASGQALLGGALLGIFAFGHALPVLAAAIGSRGAAAIARLSGARNVAAIVGAALSIAVGAYYAVLA